MWAWQSKKTWSVESSFSSESPSNPVVVEESLDAPNKTKRDTPTTTPDLEDPINSSSELEKVITINHSPPI